MAETIADMIDRGWRLHEAGQLEQAQHVYLAVLVKEPGHGNALHLLARTEFQLGNAHKAADLLERAIVCEPANPAYRFRLGQVYAEANKGDASKTDLATAAYRETLRLKPDHAEAANELGKILRAQDKIDEAIRCFRQALRARPNFVEASTNLGAALNDRGDWDEALAYFVSVGETPPHDPSIDLNLRGIAFGQKGELAEAESCFRDAIRLKPSNFKAHTNLGNVLSIQKKWDEALAAYDEALRIHVHSPEAHYNLGNALMALGRFEDAARSYDGALRLQPEFFAALTNKGNALRVLGRLDEAARCFRESLRLHPEFPGTHCSLGDVLAKQQQFAEAALCYQQALTLRSDFPDARRKLEMALGLANTQRAAAQGR